MRMLLKLETGIQLIPPSLVLQQSDLFNTDNLCILNTLSHRQKPVNWDNHHADKNTLFLGQIFVLLHFSFSGKIKKRNDIFIRKHSNYNSPDLGSIFLIEVKRKQRKKYT